MEQHEEKNARVQLEFMDRTVPLEVTAEFSLPDYRSEISRLLWVRPTVMPPERFIGGGKADFSGVVRFDILYAGPDGALYSTEQENAYSLSVPLEALAPYDAAAGVELCAAPVADAVVSRVTGPRKLSVRCRMHARVHGFAEKDLSVHLKDAQGREEKLCRLCDVVESGRARLCNRESILVTDTLETEGDLRVIEARGCVFLSESNAARDEIRCRGELLLTLLLCHEGEEVATPYTVCRRVPFEQAIGAEGVTGDYRVCVTATVGEIHTTVEENKIYIEAQGILNATAASEEPVVICRDLFLPDATADCHFSKEALWLPTICCNRNFSVSGERLLSELGMDAQVEILDTVADAELREKSVDGTRITLNGELCCHVLCRQGGEFSVMDATYPFRIFLEGEDAEMSVTCHVCSCRTNILHDSLRVDAELQLALCGKRITPSRVLTDAAFTPAEGDTRTNAPEIYYPSSRETLWDVAKRYALSPEDLAAANGMIAESPAAEDSLRERKFLLIP